MAEGQSKLVFPLCFGMRKIPSTASRYKKAYHCTFLQDLASNLKRLRSNIAILWSLQVHLNGIPPAD